ncbi:MAG TPA: prepilin-type N-terminal cleavage/methylation domain-containing protein [Candidatus Saccharimonadales bacterium]|nr:prepilin-type N-terminal cleavage/methylation domain-containing protein [Candidatus Saccharimonadales bacterium]
MIRSTRRRQSGFTLVELTLAMAFLSTIFLLIALVTMQLMAIYNRGLAIKQINEVGSSIMSDINHVSNSGINTQFSAGPNFICIGDTGYYWNTMQTLNSDGPHYYFTDDSQPIGVIKTNNTTDDAGLNCSGGAMGTNKPVDRNQVTSLVGDTVRVISLDTRSDSDNNHVHQLSLTIGTYTEDGSNQPIFKDGRWQCPPSSIGQFCAVDTFKTVIYLPNS